MATNKAFSPQAREAGQKTRAKMAALREKVARKLGVRPSDLYGKRITDTIAKNNLLYTDIPAVLLPKKDADRGAQTRRYKKRANGSGVKSEGELWSSIPLENIPEKPERGRNSTPKPRVKKFTTPPPLGDNAQVIMRLLDLVDRLL